MKKLLIAATLALFAFSGVVKADEHHGDHGRDHHHEFHGDRGGHELGWFLGGALLGAIVVHEGERERTYHPPMRLVTECRDVVYVDYYGYERLRRECRDVYVPVEE